MRRGGGVGGRTGASVAPPKLALLALALCVFSLFAFAPHDARSQERRRTIVEMLFGGPALERRERPPRRVIVRKAAPKAPKSGKRSARTSGATGTAKAAAAAAAAAAVPNKSATARTVLVVGDFMAASLAGGLATLFSAAPDVRIDDSADGSSGLVREDHLNWPTSIGGMIETVRPAVVVVMLGSNDRQAIKIGSVNLGLGTEEWAAEYAKRSDRLTAAIRERKVPFVWVGMPAFKSDRMSEDMTFLNEIFRKASIAAGGEFVDVWEGFVDAGGAFASLGPDVSGRQVSLRNDDGVTMTAAGAAKLAFFAEKPILRILGPTATTPVPKGDNGTSEAMTRLTLPPIVNVANTASLPTVGLDDPALDGADALLGGESQATFSLQPSPRDRLVVAGRPAPAVAGRADNFDWSAPPADAGRSGGSDAAIRGSADLTQVRARAQRAPGAPGTGGPAPSPTGPSSTGAASSSP